MKTKIVTLTFACALTAVLVWCAMAENTQYSCASEMVRLRVVAASDAPEDQTLKLLVRDAVLNTSETILAEAETREDAVRLLRENMDALGSAASETVHRAGRNDSVRAYLHTEGADTRRYGMFTLPAGQWLTLRVDIGDAEGKNWWCVVFPPLCRDAALEDAKETLGDGTERFIFGGEEEYVLRFRTLELLEEFRQWIRK